MQPGISMQGPIAVCCALQGPVAVLSVCGRARQGKSWLLNQLAAKLTGSQPGFKVSGQTTACTKGLWIWSKPISRTSSAGTQQALSPLPHAPC